MTKQSGKRPDAEKIDSEDDTFDADDLLSGSKIKGALFESSRLVRQTLNEQIYGHIKEAIISGNLLPGSVLTIRDLASTFGVSMMPVREALSRLVAEHALVILQNRSVAVPTISANRFDQVTQIRTLLEGLAVRTAVPKLDKSCIDELKAINREMEGIGWDDQERYLNLNRRFHFLVYRASELDFLINVIESLWLQVGPLLNYLDQSSLNESGSFFDHHAEIIKAIEARDAEMAAKAVCDDILSAAVIIRPAILKSNEHKPAAPSG